MCICDNKFLSEYMNTKVLEVYKSVKNMFGKYIYFTSTYALSLLFKCCSAFKLCIR
jgi:hypothetical protein